MTARSRRPGFALALLVLAAGCAATSNAVFRTLEGPRADEIWMSRFARGYGRAPTFGETVAWRDALDQRVAEFLGQRPALLTSPRASQFRFHRQVISIDVQAMNDIRAKKLDRNAVTRVYDKLRRRVSKLLCVDLANGKKVWERDTAKEWTIPPAFFGVGSTPVLESNLLFVMVGGQPNSGMVAVDAETGKTVWESVGKKNWEGVPMTGWPVRYFATLATSPSCPTATMMSSGAKRKRSRSARSTRPRRQSKGMAPATVVSAA